MRNRRYRWVLFGFFFVTAFAWWLLAPSEPDYEGKKLSTWLDELQALTQADQANPRTPQVRAVRAIGTNAIPWLLKEMEMHGGVAWKSRVNQVLKKQTLISYRLPNPNHPMRSEVGFRALGELGEPAISAILALAAKHPDYGTRTLAAIGRPAIPALQNCLTNTAFSTNTLVNSLVPVNTIGAVFMAGTIGSLTFPDIEILIPSIKAWAEQSTNRSAQRNAAFVLDQLGLQE
jgi:hypothetical protein